MKNLKLKWFTLVEILIVIVIVASLMAIVLRNISGSQEKSRNTGRIQIISKISTDVAAIVANSNEYPAAWLNNILAAADMPKDARNLKWVWACFNNWTTATAFWYLPLANNEWYALLSRLEPQWKNAQATIAVAAWADACAVFSSLGFAAAKAEIEAKKCWKVDCEAWDPYYVIIWQ